MSFSSLEASKSVAVAVFGEDAREGLALAVVKGDDDDDDEADDDVTDGMMGEFLLLSSISQRGSR
jgi:hypothetical protein